MRCQCDDVDVPRRLKQPRRWEEEYNNRDGRLLVYYMSRLDKFQRREEGAERGGISWQGGRMSASRLFLDTHGPCAKKLIQILCSWRISLPNTLTKICTYIVCNPEAIKATWTAKENKKYWFVRWTWRPYIYIIMTSQVPDNQTSKRSHQIRFFMCPSFGGFLLFVADQVQQTSEALTSDLIRKYSITTSTVYLLILLWF